MPFLERDGDIYVLSFGTREGTDSENRFHPDWIDEFHALLDEVQAHEGPTALVTTATGKFYSNGLDTDWLFANMGEMHGYLDRVHTIFARLIVFPMATVAAVNGHAFGAGAMTVSSHDFRVMRGDRGYYCLPEVNLGMPFTVGMNALVRNQLGVRTAVATMTTGRRFGAADAITAGIVDEAADADKLVETAVARAGALAQNRGPAIARIKADLHADTLAALAVANTAENLAFGRG
ncbi:enoyl-CoA hydratase-related protein [Aldersonia sp. NBC_00410]|uniref:enoyl-CoA hydratase-related protein n=1 Tax=Aldersonia sp. NBC_00410 TaxID=2975954 RepID=UPI00225BE36F|nr:enoyl-CoA hydratase-related protein [Aldersonia sp. NBC_00410]MCX5044480.1 enoyl-CoA hydratase-related protein [Aldersonia sp. NBC_00410]